MSETSKHKSALRRVARKARTALVDPQAGQKLIDVFPYDPAHLIIAGFAPIGDEIDIWPLLNSLHRSGHHIALPVVLKAKQPLIFRTWTPECDMSTDRYGVSYPTQGATLSPTLILVPLLAFTSHGDRLGYGGGYYDRTLAGLRRNSEVFACGVAYAGQEVAELPTDAHDAKLDGILTEIGFKAFA